MTAEEYLKALGYSFTFPDGRLDLSFEMEAENVIHVMEAYAEEYAKACLENQWISVKDVNPEPGKYYVVYSEEYGEHRAYRESYGWYLDAPDYDDRRVEVEDVTHYKSPQPPKQ
jgi:hypothetical protein